MLNSTLSPKLPLAGIGGGGGLSYFWWNLDYFFSWRLGWIKGDVFKLFGSISNGYIFLLLPKNSLKGLLVFILYIVYEKPYLSAKDWELL